MEAIAMKQGAGLLDVGAGRVRAGRLVLPVRGGRGRRRAAAGRRAALRQRRLAVAVRVGAKVQGQQERTLGRSPNLLQPAHPQDQRVLTQEKKNPKKKQKKSQPYANFHPAAGWHVAHRLPSPRRPISERILDADQSVVSPLLM